MNKLANRWVLMVSMVIICMLGKSTLVHGSTVVPSTIRVGLRSNYQNKSSIEIKNTQLDIGYERDNRFATQETLSSNTGFVIKPNKKQYYSNGNTFSTYNNAVHALLGHKNKGEEGIVVYSSPNTWRVYLEDNLKGLEGVSHTGLEIVVQDGAGVDLILCENNEVAPAFVGKGSTHSFDLTELSKGLYRGWFEFVRKGNSITAVNIVDYEDYLYGVIAAEMPASWGMEALKAQAVAARSMSMYQYNKYVKDGYNVCDTVYTQVYKGFNGEYPSTNQAVDETRGIVVTYNGKIAETLFYSTSGGYTEDPQYVWGNQVAYLQAIPDPYETEPEMKPWTRTITLADLDLCLSKQKTDIGKATGIRINSYTPAGRVNELEIMGTNGSHKLVRENIRTFFSSTKEGSLRGRMFTIQDGVTQTESGSFENVHIHGGGAPRYMIGANGKAVPVGDILVVEGSTGKTTYGSATDTTTKYGDIVISGKGYGHGVGMSQSGARGMAAAGYTYDEIIKFYYQGVELGR